MQTSVKYSVLIAFLVGLIAGVGTYQGLLWKNDLVVIDKQTQEQQSDLIAEMQKENRQLSNALIDPKPGWIPLLGNSDLPYDENADARAAVYSGREKALQDRRFLMVTFGANWCPDCRTLHSRLKSREVADYTEDRFYFVNVNVGEFDQNADIAAELGVTLARGIPVAIFFDIDGRIIGTTNAGQLEPSRRYSSKQILKFMRDVAERSRILAPDAAR